MLFLIVLSPPRVRGVAGDFLRGNLAEKEIFCGEENLSKTVADRVLI